MNDQMMNPSDAAEDRDLYLVVDYLAGELDADQTAAVNERLASDPPFYERTKLIHAALSIPGSIPSKDEDVALVRQSMQGEPAAGPRRRGWRRLPPREVLLPLRQLAAVIIGFVALAGGGYVWQHTQSIQEGGHAWSLAHLGVVNHSNDEQLVTLPGVSQVVLAPKARMWSTTTPGPGGFKESLVRLEGAARATVSDESGGMLVVTTAGEAQLAPGHYAIAMTDSNTMSVNVESGSALVRGRSPSGVIVPEATLGPGQRVQVKRRP